MRERENGRGQKRLYEGERDRNITLTLRSYSSSFIYWFQFPTRYVLFLSDITGFSKGGEVDVMLASVPSISSSLFLCTTLIAPAGTVAATGGSMLLVKDSRRKRQRQSGTEAPLLPQVTHHLS